MLRTIPRRTRAVPCAAETIWLASIAAAAALAACATNLPRDVETDEAVRAQRAPANSFQDVTTSHAHRMLEEGRDIFRYDTFGSEAFWGDLIGYLKSL